MEIPQLERCKMAKTKNPLYVVKNNGQDVETALNYFDLLLKKFNLDALIPIVQTLVDMLFQGVKSYPMFLEVKKVFDQIFDNLINLLFEIQQKLTAKKI